jgi:hypothetical protein
MRAMLYAATLLTCVGASLPAIAQPTPPAADAAAPPEAAPPPAAPHHHHHHRHHHRHHVPDPQKEAQEHLTTPTPK